MVFQLHREDIKAALRKRYGSVTAFEEAKGLPKKSVSDVLRGRSAAETEQAIVNELATKNSRPAKRQKDQSNLSDISDETITTASPPHRLTQAAR